MSGEMTAARLAEIRARADAATVGPWEVVHDVTEVSIESVPLVRFVCHLNSNMQHYWADAELIANARDDIPDLLAALAAETARADRLQEAARDVLDDGEALLTHYRRHTEHRCEIDRDAEQSLTKLRALLPAAARKDAE